MFVGCVSKHQGGGKNVSQVRVDLELLASAFLAASCSRSCNYCCFQSKHTLVSLCVLSSDQLQSMVLSLLWAEEGKQ